MKRSDFFNSSIYILVPNCNWSIFCLTSNLQLLVQIYPFRNNDCWGKMECTEGQSDRSSYQWVLDANSLTLELADNFNKCLWQMKPLVWAHKLCLCLLTTKYEDENGHIEKSRIWYVFVETRVFCSNYTVWIISYPQYPQLWSMNRQTQRRCNVVSSLSFQWV